MKYFKTNLLLVLILVLATTGLSAQPKVSNPSGVIALYSKGSYAWDRINSQGLVSISSYINSVDTTYYMNFALKKSKGMTPVRRNDPLDIYFQDGDSIRLLCNETSIPGYEHDVFVGVAGIIPYGYSTSYGVMQLSYKVEKEQLLRIVAEPVSYLAFYNAAEPIVVKIRSNKFSLAVGEECASLKSHTSLPSEVATQQVTSKDLFGDAKLRRPSFGWNNKVLFSVGYDHVFSSLEGEAGLSMMPRNLFSLDCALAGFYFGCSLGQTDVYNDLKMTTSLCKFGPAFRYGTLRNRLVMAPYVGAIQADLKDDDHHSEKLKSEFLYGARVSVLLNHIELGGNLSNKHAGLFVGYSF